MSFTFAGAGAAEGAVDAANMLKPRLWPAESWSVPVKRRTNTGHIEKTKR